MKQIVKRALHWLVSSFNYSPIQVVEVTFSSETSVNYQPTAQHFIPEYIVLKNTTTRKHV